MYFVFFNLLFLYIVTIYGYLNFNINSNRNINHHYFNKLYGKASASKGAKGPPPRVRKPTKRDTMLENMIADSEFYRKPIAPKTKLLDDPELPSVYTAVKAADMRKAKNIHAMRISHVTEVTTFMIIVEGNSRPQNQAIAISIEESMWEDHTIQAKKEGDAASGWLILDYGTIIVHIMTPKTREFYKLERRWKDAEIVDLSNILLDGPTPLLSDEMPPDLLIQEDEDDPFWT